MGSDHAFRHVSAIANILYGLVRTAELQIRVHAKHRFGEALSLATCCLMIFFASWTGSFGMGRWFLPSTVSVALAIFGITVRLLTSRPLSHASLKLERHDLAFAGVLVLAAISAAVSPNPKTLNYLLAYGYAYVGMNYLVRLALENNATGSEILFKTNVIAALVVCLFCLAEFMSRYYVGASIQAWIPRTNVANAIYFIFPRVYGFSEEPTYVAWYLNTMGPIAICTIWTSAHRTIFKTLATAVILVGWILTFSLAAIVCVVAGAIAALTVIIWKHRDYVCTIRWLPLAARSLAVCASCLILLMICTQIPTSSFSSLIAAAETAVPDASPYSSAPLASIAADDEGALDRMMDKVNGTNADSRQTRWQEHLNLVETRPLFGFGPGYLSSIDQESSNNLFVFTAVESGVPAAILLIAGMAIILLRMAASKNPRSVVFIFAFSAGVVHLLSMSQFYHPCLWLVSGLFFMSEKRTQVAT